MTQLPPHAHERRPHAFQGRLYDDKCKVCHLARWNTDEIHSPEAVCKELERLWRLEDAVLEITGDLFHRISVTETNYFVTHPLECRARGLHLCTIQHRLNKHLGDDRPLPPEGEWRVELVPEEGDGDYLQFDVLPA